MDSHIKISRTYINVDGLNRRETFFVDRIRRVGGGFTSDAISCGHDYHQELAIARQHASAGNMVVLDMTQSPSSAA